MANAAVDADGSSQCVHYCLSLHVVKIQAGRP